MIDGIFIAIFLPLTLFILILLSLWVMIRNREHSSDNISPAFWVPDTSSPQGPVEKYRFPGSFVAFGFQQPSPTYNSDTLSSLTPVESGDDVTCYYQDEIVAQLYNKICVGTLGNCISSNGQSYSPGESVQEYMPPASSSGNIGLCDGRLVYIKTRNTCIYYNGTFQTGVCDPTNQDDIFVALSINLSSVLKNGLDATLSSSDKKTSGNLLQFLNRNTGTSLDVDTTFSYQGTLNTPPGCQGSITGNIYPLTLSDPEDMVNQGYVWLVTPSLFYCKSGAASGGVCISGDPIALPQMIVYVGGINLADIEIQPNPTLIISQQILEFIAVNGGLVLVSDNNNLAGAIPLLDVLNSITSCNAPSIFADYIQPGIDSAS